MLLEHEQKHGFGVHALVTACSCNTNGIMVWGWMFLEHERNYGLGMDAAGPRMLLEHEQKHGFGVHALVTACSCNTNGIMVWGWMFLEHERNYGLGMDAAGPSMLLEHEQKHGFGVHALVTAGSCNTDGIMVWGWMFLEHERNYGLGMDALVIECSWNTNGIMVWASLYSARRGVRGLNPSPPVNLALEFLGRRMVNISILVGLYVPNG